MTLYYENEDTFLTMNLPTINLDPRLESDSSPIINLTLCQIRLHHNAAFPWILLIPQQEGLSEIIDLCPPNQLVLMQEIALCSEIMRDVFNPKKLNIASLGNIVPQLHVHIIARYTTDGAWPNPIWNSGVTESYRVDAINERIIQLKSVFENRICPEESLTNNKKPHPN